MKADDPRHGTERGYTAHRRAGSHPCDACKEAHRRRNIERQLRPPKVPALGSQRRIQALQAIGWGRDRIAAELGYTNAGALTYLMRATTMYKTTADRIADVYDRLSMTVPVGIGPKRARTWARRHGYAPPLAWDDIDNPAEQPRGVGYQQRTRAEILHDLDEQRGRISDACDELGVNRNALEVWCRRNGMSDLYSRLVMREIGEDKWRQFSGKVGA